jgi:heme oxygenase
MMIDRIVLRLDLARREDYGLLLNVHYTTLRDLAVNWRDEDRGDFLNMAYCLQMDLHGLGFSAAAGRPIAPATTTAGAGFGIAYAIRGSRSEAMRHRGRVSPGFGASYLDFSPSLTWARFLEQLERHVSKSPERDETHEVIGGARTALASFTSNLAAAFA